MTRKIILGDQVIGGLPPQPPEPPTPEPATTAVCTCGHNRVHHATGAGVGSGTGFSYCTFAGCFCDGYHQRPFEPVSIGVQGTSVETAFTAPAFLFETSASPFPTVQSVQLWACPGCHADLANPVTLATHLALAHEVVRTSASIESVAGLPLSENFAVRDNNGSVIGSVIVLRVRLYTEQAIRVETTRYVKPTFGPFAILTTTVETIPMSALLDQMGNAAGTGNANAAQVVPLAPWQCEHANEVPSMCPCPPYCPCQLANGPCAHPAVPNSPAPAQYTQARGNFWRRIAQRVLFAGIPGAAESLNRANRPDYGYCQCGHTMRQHETDRTGNSPEPCRICPCAQYQRGT